MGLLPKNRLFASLKFKGCDMKAALSQLQDIKQEQEATAFTEAQASSYLNSKYQQSQRDDIVKYHFKNTPFYREICNHTFPENWDDVPIMEKGHLRSNPEERLSQEFNIKDVIINSTSGSSGHPIRLARDKAWHALIWAQVAKNYNRANIEVGVDKEARFYGKATGKLARFIDGIKTKAANRTKFDVYNTSDESLAAAVKEIVRGNHVFINGYTSAIKQLATYCQNSGIVLSKSAKHLKAVMCTSEMLVSEHAQIIKQGIGVPLYNEYGASECGIISFALFGEDWPINSSLLYIEAVDENGVSVKEGETGDLLVTCLHSKASPLIRYRIGDRGSLCFKNGRWHIQSLEGRSNQFIKFTDGHKVIGLIVLSATKAMMKAGIPIIELIAEQKELDHLEVFYSSERELNSDELHVFEKAIFQLAGREMKINFNKLDAVPRSKSGKLLQFTSKL